jgi:hypothetical protein
MAARTDFPIIRNASDRVIGALRHLNAAAV